MPNARIIKTKRAAMLAALCEGMAINSLCRVFKVGKPNVLRFIKETGQACEDWHNRNFRNLSFARLELDEQWNYVHTHRERMSKAERMDYPEKGDAWLWASIDPESKAIVNWRTGKRTATAAHAFAGDLAGRVVGRVQITSDQLAGYRYALPQAFGDRVDHAQEKKIFQNIGVQPHQWNARRVDPLVGVIRSKVRGNPNLETSTVCHMERFWLTMRQGNKRHARKTLAYSKKWDNHALSSSIHVFVYNLVRKHEGLDRLTPAVALGIVARRWTLEDVVTMTDDFLAAQNNLRFEQAFSMFSTKPSSQRTYPPQKPLTPWYLDPESGGPNPPVRKDGIKYDD